MEQLTLLSEAPPAKDSASQESEADWMTTVLGWPGSSLTFLAEHGPAGWSGRTSPVACQLGQQTRTVKCQREMTPNGPKTKQTILTSSCTRWGSAGMGSPIGFLTLNTCEWNHTLVPSHSGGGVCSLSDILETGDLPQRYYLSARACAGILRRAEKWGKVLPSALRNALEARAGELTGKTVTH